MQKQSKSVCPPGYALQYVEDPIIITTNPFATNNH